MKAMVVRTAGEPLFLEERETSKPGPGQARIQVHAWDEVAETHSRKQHNIRPEMYDLWLDSLCETVRRHDPKFTPELEDQWREWMREGIDFIVARY